MKKIMFNDRYGLTQAVLDGRKTMTRRLINLCENDLHFMKISDRGEYLFCSKTALDGAFPRYKVGEILAVAQSYHELNKSGYVAPEWLDHACESSAGYNNKMFVRAELMPYRIKITNIKVERLQDISDEDCLKEGVQKGFIGYYVDGLKTKDWEKESHVETADGKTFKLFPYPQEAFAALIDKVCGRGTWNINPYVFVYEFELLKGGKK